MDFRMGSLDGGDLSPPWEWEELDRPHREGFRLARKDDRELAPLDLLPLPSLPG